MHLRNLRTIILSVAVLGLQTGNAFASRRGLFEGTVLQNPHSNVMNMGGGVMVADIAAMPGVDLQIATKLSSDISLYAGGELGLFVLTGNYATAAVVPMLGTVFVEFDATERVRPVLGASFGPTISTSNQFSSVRMTFLFNPGINIDLKGGLDLSILARFGVIGSSFVAIPQVGLTIAI